MNLKYSACLWVATKNKIYLICQWCNVTPLTCYLTTDSSLALKCIHKPNMIVIIYDLFDYNWKWLFFNKIIESVRATLQRMTMQHLTHFAENDPEINTPYSKSTYNMHLTSHFLNDTQLERPFIFHIVYHILIGHLPTSES